MSKQRTKHREQPAEPGDAARVGILIGRGESKSALDLAKQIHKRETSAASEHLLIEAYLARIQALASKQMLEEADALAALVREKYPASGPRLQETVGRIALHRGDLDDLLQPLLDPDLSRERRETIEETIKREVVDLQSLATCPVLPPDHPLRRGAAALAAAFDAVTQGPVADDAIALPEIPRRGPLASWKALVRAIAALYRREDETCRRFLGAVEPGSVPARLVPALNAICSGKPAHDLPESAARLVDQVCGGSADLEAALAQLETCFDQAKPRAILRQIPGAIDLCRRVAPDLVQRLRVHITVRAAVLNVPEKPLQAALGGALRLDAEYWRLFAAAIEKYHDPELLPVIFDAWGEFRLLALQSGRLAANSLEEAVLLRHLAEILASYPAADLELCREMYEDVYADNSLHLRKGTLPPEEFFPQSLFARSCAIDPDGDTFGAWLAWAKKQEDRAAAEQAAEAWHKAIQDDVEPLLFLAMAAQGRGAFQRALTWLAHAERLDALNPEVHRMKMLILIAAAVRHLQQKKLSLLEADLVALEALPLCREGDRPAFLQALRWSLRHALGRKEEAAAARDAVVSILGDVAAATILSSLALHGGLSADDREALVPEPDAGHDKQELAADVARACALGAGLGFRPGIPKRWEKRLISELAGRRDGPPLPSGPLYELAVTAAGGDDLVPELAYAATVAGIDGEGEMLPRFLLLRARLLPQSDEERRVHAIAAALELARRRRDLACIDAAVEIKPTLSWAAQDLLEELGRSLSSEQVQVILERERQQRAFASQRRSGPSLRQGRTRAARAGGGDNPEPDATRREKGRRGAAGNPSAVLDDQSLVEMMQALARSEADRKNSAADRKRTAAEKRKEALERQGNLFDPP